MAGAVNFIYQDGIGEAIIAAGHILIKNGDVWQADDPVAVQAIINSYNPLSFAKTNKQAALDAFFNAHFDLAAFIRGGTVATVTGAQIGTFLATITNNYRGKRAAISAAADLATVNAIDVTAGWPSNP